MYSSRKRRCCLPGWTALGPQDHESTVKTAIFLEFLVQAFNSEQYSNFPFPF